MPTTDEKPSDDVEKVLSDLKSIEDRKQALIDDLLRQKADAMKAFDEKLLKLGWKPDSTGKKKSHHKAPSSGTPAKPKAPAAPAAGPVSAPSKTKRKA
jgi:hypothetical protein